MKELPEAARAIVERARDAHDPSEAQLQHMLANLHAQLGYEPAAPNEPAGATTAAAGGVRGLLHIKLLKLALSIAAIGGMVVLVAPRLWTAEPVQVVPAGVPSVQVSPTAAAVGENTESAAVGAREESADVATSSGEVLEHGAARGGGARATRSRGAASVARGAEGSATLSGGAIRTGKTGARPGADGALGHGGANTGESAGSAMLPTTGNVVTSADAERAQVQPVSAAVSGEHADSRLGRSVAAPEEKVLLSDDVVPLQTARKRAEARGASDADELRLIDRAASLLRDGEPEEALELLQEHGRKFPASQLKVERRGLSVLARCGAGQVEQGRREREEFLRDAGKAPIAARVRKACPESKP